MGGSTAEAEEGASGENRKKKRKGKKKEKEEQEEENPRRGRQMAMPDHDTKFCLLNHTKMTFFFLKILIVSSLARSGSPNWCHSSLSCAGAHDSGFVYNLWAAPPRCSMLLLGEFGILLFCSPGFWDVSLWGAVPWVWLRVES